MKKSFLKIAFLLVALMSSQMLLAQVEPILPLLDNGYYPVEKVKELAFGDSKKSIEFRANLILLVQEKIDEAGIVLDQRLGNKSLTWIFKNIEIQETKLNAGEWSNSGWNTETEKIKLSVSKTSYEGPCGIFSFQNIAFAIWKGNCANLTDAPLVRVNLFQEKQEDPTVQQVAPNLPPQQQFQQQPQIQYIEVPVPVEVPVYIQQEQCYEEPYYRPSTYVQRTVRSRYGNNYGYGYDNGYSSGYGYGSPVNLSLGLAINSSRSNSSSYSSNTNTNQNYNTNNNTNNNQSYNRSNYRRPQRSNSSTGQGSMSSGAGDYSYGGSGGEGGGRPSSSYTPGVGGGSYGRATAVRSTVGGGNRSGGTAVRSTVGRGN